MVLHILKTVDIKSSSKEGNPFILPCIRHLVCDSNISNDTIVDYVYTILPLFFKLGLMGNSLRSRFEYMQAHIARNNIRENFKLSTVDTRESYEEGKCVSCYSSICGNTNACKGCPRSIKYLKPSFIKEEELLVKFLLEKEAKFNKYFPTVKDNINDIFLTPIDLNDSVGKGYTPYYRNLFADIILWISENTAAYFNSISGSSRDEIKTQCFNYICDRCNQPKEISFNNTKSLLSDILYGYIDVKTGWSEVDFNKAVNKRLNKEYIPKPITNVEYVIGEQKTFYDDIDLDAIDKTIEKYKTNEDTPSEDTPNEDVTPSSDEIKSQSAEEATVKETAATETTVPCDTTKELEEIKEDTSNEAENNEAATNETENNEEVTNETDAVTNEDNSSENSTDFPENVFEILDTLNNGPKKETEDEPEEPKEETEELDELPEDVPFVGENNYLIDNHQQICLKYSMDLAFPGALMEFENAVLKDRFISIEAILDDNNDEILIFRSRRGKVSFFHVYMNNKECMDYIAPYLSRRGFVKICYQPYYLYSYCRKYNAPLKRVYSICTCHSLLTSDYSEGVVKVLSYRNTLESYMSEEWRYGLPPLLAGMSAYAHVVKRQERAMAESEGLGGQSMLSEMDELVYYDEALGLSFGLNNLFKPETNITALFKLTGLNEFEYTPINSIETIPAGRFVDFIIDTELTKLEYAHQIIYNVIIDLVENGRFRKINLYILDAKNNKLSMFIPEYYYQHLMTILGSTFTSVARKIGIEHLTYKTVIKKAISSEQIIKAPILEEE